MFYIKFLAYHQATNLNILCLHLFAKIDKIRVGNRKVAPTSGRGKSGQQNKWCSAKAGAPVKLETVRATVTNRVAPGETIKLLGRPTSVGWAILPAATGEFYLIGFVPYGLLGRGNNDQAKIDHFRQQNPAYRLPHKK